MGDRESITPEVCFKFCRTIEDMGFFGIRNGNQCYCTPYYKSIAGDDSMCDVVCEGDGTQICGSKTKSSMFGMHMCTSTQADLNTVSGKATTVKDDLDAHHTKVDTASTGMQSAAAEYQTLFGNAGDPVAADLMQSAKVRAGELAELAKLSGNLKTKVENAITTASLLGGTVGLLTGGVWVGAALFAASSYLSRQEESDLSTALKGVSTTALETLNFGAYLNDKYAVTNTISDSFASALESSPEAKKSVDDAWSGVSEAYNSVDQDVGIKDTLGTILASGSELASQAIDKAVELNDQYKVTDQIGEKISEVIDKAQSSTKKA